MNRFLNYMAITFVLIGAFNWGLVGLFGFDLVAFLFGEMSLLSRIIYSIVGISSIAAAYGMYNAHKECYENCQTELY
jgi:hypothetical protein